MSAGNDFSAADWVKRRLAELHHQLAQSGDLPESARQLWNRVKGELPQPAPLVDEARVREIAQATLDGIDIEADYPVFFDMLVADEKLQAEFLRVMTSLEDQRQGEPPLSARPPAQIEIAAHGWRIIWQLTAVQIQAAFDWQRQSLAYRDMQLAVTPARFLLLQSRTEVSGDEVAVALTARYQAESPDMLQLSVSVGSHTDSPMVMQVQVGWGAYAQAVIVAGGQEQPLPAAPLVELLDETGEYFRHDLRLTLEAHPL